MKMDEKLVRLRKEKGLTQLELAEAVKVSRQAVSKWESGSSVPSIENLKYLGELYSVPVDYLVNDDIECIGCQEKITESPVKQQIGRKKYRWLIIAVCIIGHQLCKTDFSFFIYFFIWRFFCTYIIQL